MSHKNGVKKLLGLNYDEMHDALIATRYSEDAVPVVPPKSLTAGDGSG